MAELDLTAIAPASIATPAAGVQALFVDNGSLLLTRKDSVGSYQAYMAGLKTQSVIQSVGYAVDTYLVGSSIALGAGVSPLAIGSRYHCTFDVTKTAAGVVAPVIIVRFGTAGAVGDAARLTFTFNAQTAVIDNGRFELWASFRAVGNGVNAILQGIGELRHNLAITGLGSVNPTGYQQLLVTSGGFDSTPVNSIIGVSVNGGAAAAWTIQLVEAELLF